MSTLFLGALGHRAFRGINPSINKADVAYGDRNNVKSFAIVGAG
jgi:hypothetical protein